MEEEEKAHTKTAPVYAVKKDGKIFTLKATKGRISDH